MRKAGIERMRPAGLATHAAALEEVARALATDASTGLTSTEVEARLARYGSVP